MLINRPGGAATEVKMSRRDGNHRWGRRPAVPLSSTLEDVRGGSVGGIPSPRAAQCSSAHRASSPPCGGPRVRAGRGCGAGVELWRRRDVSWSARAASTR